MLTLLMSKSEGKKITMKGYADMSNAREKLV